MDRTKVEGLGCGARRVALWLAALLAWAVGGAAQAYMVGPALSVEELSTNADLIFQGKVVSSEPVSDAWFKPLEGFVARETQFRVISVLKGEAGDATLRFRHYETDPEPRPRMFEPLYYHFDRDRTYLVFARRSETPGVFRQFQANHTARRDQGVVRCADDTPLPRQGVKEAIWGELTRLLAVPGTGDVLYAIGQLDQMSGGVDNFDGTRDFDRTNVLQAVVPFLTATNASVAQAAITLVGSHNPYLFDERGLFWLATVGSAEIPGIGRMDPRMKNTGGEIYGKDLVALAESPAPSEIRSSAIRALGLVRDPALAASIDRWLADPSTAVRASATLLLADFPGPEIGRHLAILAADPAPEVRVGVARAAGFGQRSELTATLARLLADQDRHVREAAAMSLLSFSPTNPAIRAVFRANLENEEFNPLFLLALAAENPADHLAGLAPVVEQKTEPKNFWGGQIPAFTAWKLLFRYLRAQPSEALASGKLDRYLDALEKVGNYSSSEPRDIYAFYIQRGLTGRARTFREAANKAAQYDLDYYFKQVDQNPSNYLQ